jgi:signal transduction histidine kinase
MASSSDIEQDLAALADHLGSRRDTILNSMRKAVSEDPRLAIAAKLPRAQFQDHLPQLLDAFEARLRAHTPRERSTATTSELANAEQHGRNRWQQGYNLGETILEWRHLHECLLEEVERFSDVGKFSASALHMATRELSTLLGEGVSESAQEHAQLHQLESQARAAELTAALERARAVETASSHTWREALHDLRGSMGLVRNASALLARDALPYKVRVQSRDILKRGVAAVAELLEELTDLARLESGQERVNVTRFDAAHVLEGLCTTTRPLAATQGLSLRSEGPRELLVNGDALKVHRIAQNLLLNAIKYTQQGGVWVRWQLDAQPGVARWILTIEDSGPGMATDALPAVSATGRPVSTQPPSPERSEGLGLPIVRRLCALLDAVVEVQSSEGRGTVFRVRFPSEYPGSAAG